MADKKRRYEILIDELKQNYANNPIQFIKPIETEIAKSFISHNQGLIPLALRYSTQITHLMSTNVEERKAFDFLAKKLSPIKIYDNYLGSPTFYQAFITVKNRNLQEIAVTLSYDNHYYKVGTITGYAASLLIDFFANLERDGLAPSLPIVMSKKGLMIALLDATNLMPLGLLEEDEIKITYAFPVGSNKNVEHQEELKAHYDSIIYDPPWINRTSLVQLKSSLILKGKYKGQPLIEVWDREGIKFVCELSPADSLKHIQMLNEINDSGRKVITEARFSKLFDRKKRIDKYAGEIAMPRVE